MIRTTTPRASPASEPTSLGNDTLVSQAYTDDRLDRAAEAFERIRAGNHWQDWVDVALGLAELRDTALHTSHSNKPEGKAYNLTIGLLRKQHEWADKIDRATIAHCYWVVENLEAVESWRQTLAANQRDRWNHPSAVKSAYERKHPQQQGGDGKPKRETLREANVRLTEENDTLKHQIEEKGSDINLVKDHIKDIARHLVDLNMNRAESLARAILALIKQRGQAG